MRPDRLFPEHPKARPRPVSIRAPRLFAIFAPIAMKSKQKTIGQVFTPPFIVSAMLDYCGYHGKVILGKHVIDNSCGDGAFLRDIVRRYITAARAAGKSNDETRSDLSRYTHGVDIDGLAYEQCVTNLQTIANEYGLADIDWDVRQADTLFVRDFDGRMDYVVGNPPYVRVHNLAGSYDGVKRFSFANGGMTDLYLAFFELGFAMLAPSGRLCYITPSSWLASTAAGNMRQYIAQKRNLSELTDLGHFQPFDNATAYTVISLFDNDGPHDTFSYFRYDGNTRGREKVAELRYSEAFIGGSLHLSDSRTLAMLCDIKNSHPTKFVSVKNGFATLADKVFIGDDVPDSPITIPVVKASTAKRTKCLFPYDTKGKPLAKAQIFSSEPLKAYLLSHKEELLKGKEDFEGWYLYGRTQALGDVYRQKTSINSLIRDEKDLKLVPVAAGEGVYSGLNVTANVPLQEGAISDILRTRDFAEYVRTLKKYKSGGYYTYNSKEAEQYINHVISQNPEAYVDTQAFSPASAGLFQTFY